MSEDTLSRLYPRLAGAERFQLWLMAKERDDRADAERLTASCPQYGYQMEDAEFHQRIKAAEHLVTALMGDSNRAFGCLLALQLMSQHLTPILDRYAALLYLANHPAADDSAESEDEEEDAGEWDESDEAEDSRPEWERDPFEATRYPTATMELMHRMEIAIIAAQWDAFGAVCRQEMELEPETVLRALWPQLLARFEALRPELDGRLPLPAEYDPYQETRDAFQSIATKIWRKSISAA